MMKIVRPPRVQVTTCFRCNAPLDDPYVCHPCIGAPMDWRKAWADSFEPTITLPSMKSIAVLMDEEAKA